MLILPILPILTILPILSILPILLLTEDSQFNVDLCLSETGLAQPTWLTNMKFFGKMVKKREERSTSLHYWHNLLKHLKLASTIILRSLTHIQIIIKSVKMSTFIFMRISFLKYKICSLLCWYRPSYLEPLSKEANLGGKWKWDKARMRKLQILSCWTIFQNLVQHAHGILKYIVSSRSREIRLRRGATCACLGYFCLCQVASLGLG